MPVSAAGGSASFTMLMWPWVREERAASRRQVVALGRTIVGASVGDSVAWILDSSGLVDLTAQQKRKPLMGSGAANPVAFSSSIGTGVVVVASDGLAKYAARARIAAAATNRDSVQAVDALVDLARTRSGALQDDLALISCRRG
jgi:serine/threonine protein phosphatase PrpC